MIDSPVGGADSKELVLGPIVGIRRPVILAVDYHIQTHSPAIYQVLLQLEKCFVPTEEKELWIHNVSWVWQGGRRHH